MSRPISLRRRAATSPPPEQRVLRLCSGLALSEATGRVEGLARAAGFHHLAGVDEAGRGPWAGPVVAAAVILRTSRLPVRIDDSKRLTPAARERAFEVILRHADVGIGIVCAETIDQRNILAATFLAMQHAVQELPVVPELVLIDGSLAPPLEPPCWPIVHGDACSYPIACASIIAKVTRDRLMRFYHRLWPEYAFDQHKGYGTPEHLDALQRYGPSLLHRMTFRPVLAVGPVER